jgi:hypothetical protein
MTSLPPSPDASDQIAIPSFAPVVPRFAHSQEIIRRLEHTVRDGKADEASIAITQPGGRRRFSMDKFGAVAEVSGDDTLRIPTVCMAKMYTATIATEKFLERNISLDQDIREFSRDLYGRDISEFTGITLRQLLNNTHGLDDPSVDKYPMQSDGYMDFEGQVRRFTAVPPVTDPGLAFSMGDSGMLLVGAFLERIVGKRYAEMLALDLMPRLREHSGEGSIVDASARFCPTSGRGFAPTAVDLLNLAEHYFVHQDHVNSAAPELLDVMRSKLVPFVGFTSMGTGVGAGWHAYAGGWYGYNGMAVGGATQMVRMKPEEGIAIAVISKKLAAYNLVMNAFGEMLPEIKSLRPPRLLMPGETDISTTHAQALVGRFELGPMATEIARAGDGSFNLTMMNRTSDGRFLSEPIKRGLRLTEQRGFFSSPVELSYMTFGQIVDLETSTGSRPYLWNTRCLRRKVSN